MSRPPPHPSRELFGRSAQLAMTDAHLDDLVAGRGGLVVLTGEAGIGKTRLAEEMATRALERGATVVWATAWEGDGAPPLWPWVQVLRRLDGAEGVLDHFATTSPGESSAARFAQSEAVAGVIRSDAERHLLMVVLDDLHWADPATLRVLTALAPQLRDVSCLIVGTCRPDEFERDRLAELARAGVTIAVPRLPDDAIASLLAASVGATLSPEAEAAIVVRSAGNPLFVRELGQLLAHSGRLDVAPAAVPDAIAAIIERRLARVTSHDVELLQALAVAGSALTARELAAVAGTDDEATRVGLIRAVRAGLVATESDGHRFTHALMRDVVLAGIEPRREVELHRRAADLFISRLAFDDSFHRVVAGHLEEANEVDAATVHWEQAAHRSRRVLAHDDAAACFERAARGADPRAKAAWLGDAGDSWLMAGDLHRARACFDESARLARVVDAPDLLARAALGMGAGPVAWEVPIADAAQVELLIDALERLRPDEQAWRSRLLARLSVAAATPQTTELALQRATAALTLAEAVDDPALIAQALAAVNDALGAPHHAMTRRDNADTIVELALAAGDRMLELLGLRFRVVADLEVGDIAAADRSIAAFGAVASSLRQPLASWYVPLFRGMRALLAGDIAAADGWVVEVESATAAGSQNGAMLAATLRFGIEVASGRPTQLAKWYALVDIDPAEWATYASALAMAHWHNGGADEARNLLALHSRDGFARLGADSEQITTLFMFSRVAIGLGDLDACAVLADLLTPLAGLWAVDGIGACCWGPVELELGRLAIALDRHDAAARHLAQAEADAERVSAPLLLADIQRLRTSLDGHRSTTPIGVSTTADVELVDDHVFRCDGPFWTLKYRGRSVRVKDAKGLRDLARLLRDPGGEVHVLELVGARSTEGPPMANGDLGEVLDARARAEYRRRLAELDDELADAERCADLGRLERAQIEREFLAAELEAALGLGGRSRRTGDDTERARKAVSGRIHLTIGRIGDVHPELARHLANAVRTGTWCAYQPESPVSWTCA